MESSAGIDVVAHDLTVIVDADGESELAAGTGRIDRGELTVVQKKGVERVRCGSPVLVAGLLPPRRPRLATASAVNTAATTTGRRKRRRDLCRLPKPC